MTCIVGYAEPDGRIVMGADSCASTSYVNFDKRSHKIVRNGPFLLGVTGEPRMTQLLAWAFKPPAHPSGLCDEAYLCTLFVDAVRQCLKDGGYAKKESEKESQDSAALIGYHGNLYTLSPNYQIEDEMTPYASVGSGQEVALGALHALAQFPHLQTHDRVISALKAAAQYSRGVRGPFHVKILPAGSG